MLQYVLWGCLGFFILLYFSVSYWIYVIIERRDPGIYSGLSRIKKTGLIMLLPIIVVGMAFLHYISGDEK